MPDPKPNRATVRPRRRPPRQLPRLIGMVVLVTIRRAQITSRCAAEVWEPSRTPARTRPGAERHAALGWSDGASPLAGRRQRVREPLCGPEGFYRSNLLRPEMGLTSWSTHSRSSTPIQRGVSDQLLPGPAGDRCFRTGCDRRRTGAPGGADVHVEPGHEGDVTAPRRLFVRCGHSVRTALCGHAAWCHHPH